jgi:hypothetical protein
LSALDKEKNHRNFPEHWNTDRMGIEILAPFGAKIFFTCNLAGHYRNKNRGSGDEIFEVSDIMFFI